MEDKKGQSCILYDSLMQTDYKTIQTGEVGKVPLNLKLSIQCTYMYLCAHVVTILVKSNVVWVSQKCNKHILTPGKVPSCSLGYEHLHTSQ